MPNPEVHHIRLVKAHLTNEKPPVMQETEKGRRITLAPRTSLTRDGIMEVNAGYCDHGECGGSG